MVDTYDTMNSGVPNFLCVAYALHKVDGCTRCAECHYLGGCG